MKAKMTREQRKVATFLRHAIRDYGIPRFDVNSANVKESASDDDGCITVCYSVRVGDNIVDIQYFYYSDNDRSAYVYLNDYPLFHRKVTCMFDMVYVVTMFVGMVQHLN